MPQLLERLLHLPDAVVYALLYGASMLENVLPPVPGDTVVVFGGYLVGRGSLLLSVTFVVVTLGSWSGFMCYYLLGRWLGHTGVHAWLGRWITPQALQRAERWVQRYGQWVVLANRMLPGARSMISLAAGFAGLRADVVAGMALLSALLWNVLLVGGGYLIGEQWQRLLGLLHLYDRAALIVMALAGAAVLVRWWLRRARTTQGPEQGAGGGPAPRGP
jgi:membrane protein DedA with SNARE-associated domain